MSNALQLSGTSGKVLHPDYGEMVNYQMHTLPDDADGQVEETIRLMTGYVNADRLNPVVQETAHKVVGEAWGIDPVDAVFKHVKRAMRFRNDDQIHGKVFGQWSPVGMGDVVEILSRPCDTALAIQRGFIPEEDCDGYSTYAAGLLAALGIPCSFVTVGADSENPDRYSHVYVAAYPGEGQGEYVGKRVVLDCSHGEVIGWECPNRFGKFKEWPVYGRIDWMGLALVGLVGFAFYRWMMGKPIVPAFKLIGGVA